MDYWNPINECNNRDCYGCKLKYVQCPNCTRFNFENCEFCNLTKQVKPFTVSCPLTDEIKCHVLNIFERAREIYCFTHFYNVQEYKKLVNYHTIIYNEIRTNKQTINNLNVKKQQSINELCKFRVTTIYEHCKSILSLTNKDLETYNHSEINDIDSKIIDLNKNFNDYLENKINLFQTEINEIDSQIETLIKKNEEYTKIRNKILIDKNNYDIIALESFNTINRKLIDLINITTVYNDEFTKKIIEIIPHIKYNVIPCYWKVYITDLINRKQNLTNLVESVAKRIRQE